MAISNEFLDKYKLPTIEEFRSAMEKDETEELYYVQILNITDNVPLKIFESFIENMASASAVESIGIIVNFFKDIKITYADTLSARKTAREEIDRIRSEISTESGE